MMPASHEMATALEAAVVRPCLFYEIDHSDGAVRFWTGVGTKQWNSVSWIGGGSLISFNGVKADGQIAVQDIQVTLSGLNPAGLDLKNINVRGVPAKLWMGLLRSNQSVIPDPILLRSMELDNLDYVIDDSGKAQITVTGQSYLWATSKPTRLAWTPEEHKRKYPNDTGFDLVHTFATTKTAWRRT